MKVIKENGITLIALIITIIVLVILAGVALNMLFGNDGILNNAQYAKEQYVKSTEKEAIGVAFANLKVKLYTDDSIAEITTELLEQQLRNAGNNVEVTTNEAGNFVITFKNTGDVYEVTPTGKILGEDKTEVSDEEEIDYTNQNLSYITDKLLLHLSGENNTLEGHSSDTDTWYDISGISNKNATKTAGNINWAENALVLDGSTYYTIDAPVSNSFGTVEISVLIDEDFVPVNSTKWYQCSTIFGCELGNTQKDWAVIIDKNGKFAIGYNTETIYSSNINALDGKRHTIGYSYMSSQLVFAIDGNIINKISYSPSGTACSQFGIGWNKASANTKIKGKVYDIRFYENQLTEEEIYMNYVVDEVNTGNSSLIDNANIVPIYTEEQLRKLGNKENIIIDGKVYLFDSRKKYVMQNDITFYGDFSKIQDLIDKKQLKLDENGYTLTIVNLTNPDYFNYSTTATAATITGLSTEGRAVYNAGKLTEIEIPLVNPDGITITGIGASAFDGCNKLTDVVITQGITTLGTLAFKNCTNLERIVIPSSLTTVGGRWGDYNDQGPFLGCSKLNTVEFNGNITKIHNYMFLGCSGLETIVIPEGVTTIENYAFYSCRNLVNVTFPSTLTSIGVDSFGYCVKIANLTLSNNLTSIGKLSFRGCTGLTEITFSNSLVSIGESAFQECTGLTEIELPSGLKTLSTLAFKNCTNLESIVIPSSLTTVGGRWGDYNDQGPFLGCSKLNTVEFDGNITKIHNYMFLGCSGLETIVIPEGVTAIENYAFYSCRNLVSVTFPSTLTSIGVDSFGYCVKITSITLPNSLTSTGKLSFRSCTRINRHNIFK